MFKTINTGAILQYGKQADVDSYLQLQTGIILNYCIPQPLTEFVY